MLSKYSFIIELDSLRLFNTRFCFSISQAFLSISKNIHLSAPTFNDPIPRIPFPAPKSPTTESEDKSPNDIIEEINFEATFPSVEYCYKSTSSQG